MYDNEELAKEVVKIYKSGWTPPGSTPEVVQAWEELIQSAFEVIGEKPVKEESWFEKEMRKLEGDEDE